MVTESEVIRDKAFIELVKTLKEISSTLKSIDQNLEIVHNELSAMNDIRQYGERKD